MAFFLACSSLEPMLDPILRRGSGLPGILALAGFQFACEGLILIVILVWRRERLSSYGFTRRRLACSLGLALAFASLYDLGLSLHAGVLLWIPLRRQPATHMSLALGLPLSLVGLFITAAVWGFTEGLFGVFFARKVNVAIGHTGRGWHSPGAVTFALFNGVIHFAIGQGWEGFMTSAASGYAIGVIPAFTGNAWGSALVQTLTDAVGRR
jgi:hypothetical protein